MIKFITNREHDTTYERVDLSDCLEYCKDKSVLSLDCEFNNLDTQLATLLMVIIGDNERSYVIDATSVDISRLEPLASKLFVGHNIKIDYTVCKVNGFTFRDVFDTMIAEQRLGLGSGRKNSLQATLERRFGIPMEKETRNEFIVMNERSRFNNKHLEYAANDTTHLLRLMELQSRLIAKFDMGFLLYSIEFPLVTIIGDCELEGFVLDEEAWGKVIDENKLKKNRLLREMDTEMRQLAMAGKTGIGIQNAIMAKYCHHREIQEITHTDLFGNSVTTEVKPKKAINYGSSPQMKTLFKDFGLKPPEKMEDGRLKETMATPALEAYIKENPGTILEDFLGKYIEHSGVAKQLSTYGQSFLDMISTVTGKIHTTFRICSTDTGRFASGNTKAGFPNLQNIPAITKFRHCFGVEEGYEVTTCDLSGAELIVMVALSGDLRLLELASGDMHSHFANLCWKKIIESRGEEWTEDMVISKKQNKAKRTGFKPMGFGTIYGMYSGKASEQLGVTKEEGQIVIDTIKAEIPVVFEMVEAASKFAMEHGYIVHNTRTNSRRWFTPVLEAKKELKRLQKEDPFGVVPNLRYYLEYADAKIEHIMDWKDISSCASPARNSRIQGTQADMVKEAIVEMAKDVRKRGLDIKLLGSVHDELIYKHPINYMVDDEPVGEYIENWMCKVSNRYLLDVVEMGAEYDTTKTWTKGD